MKQSSFGNNIQEGKNLKISVKDCKINVYKSLESQQPEKEMETRKKIREERISS